MKKLSAILIGLSVAVLGVFALVSCGSDKEHVHVADSYEITVEATCTTDGVRSGVCKKCKQPFTETVPAVGHDWILKSKVPETCTEAGEATYECANCQELDERTLPALGHKDGAVIQSVPAGCETVGWTEGKKCSVCGEVITAPVEIPAAGHSFYYEMRSDDTHTVKCHNCDYSVIAECGFTEVDIAPTCTEPGKLLHTCNACGDSHEHRTAAALGHQMTENKTFYSTVDGVYKHRQTCYRCDYYDEEDCSAIRLNTVSPTCETVGYTVYSCNECGNSYNSDFTDALGHNFSDYTLDDNNSDPYSHTHRRSCLRPNCGAEERGVPVGTVGAVIGIRTDGTCEADAYTDYSCSLGTCSYSRTVTHVGTKLGHIYGEWEYSGDNDETHTHTHRCLRTDCSKTETTDCRMISSNQAATCTKPSVDIDVCQDCFHVDRDEGQPLGHSWGRWINVREPNGELKHLRDCSVCRQSEYGLHSYETTTTPADCEHDEEIVKTCSVCGYVTKTSVPNTALGHEWEVVSSNANEHSLICHRHDTDYELTAPHDYRASNLCADCDYDGLAYELSVGGDYYIVKNDNGVPQAREITVAAFRQAPGSSEMLPVRAVGASAFYRNAYITKIILPATVTAIEQNAFYGCSSLATVEFYGGDSQLVRIESAAFYNCSALTAITLSDTLKNIGNTVFYGCTQLSDIDVPESVTSIGLGAFLNTAFYNDRTNWVGGALYAGVHLIRVNPAYFTDSVADFTVKSGTLTVSEYAFENCAGMRMVHIPVSVTAVGMDAFGGCTNLREVEYDGSVSNWFAITFSTTLSSPMYYATHMSILGEISSELVLPENITSIPAGTFKGNTNITKVTIPAKVTSIGDEAFMNCVNLAQIVFENDSVSYVGKDAFLGTAFYDASENWSEGVLILGNHILATNDDFTATSYEIAENIRTVSAGAFARRDITSLTVGDGVVWFGAGAFKAESLESLTFATTGTWFAKNAGGIVRSVHVTENAVANVTLLRDYLGEWRKA